ncbi:hypothetical protein FNW02_20950 [Komarekiella sp. 'clone 1']|uniref:Phage protein D n=1 Tax=Komarekiella delphini-convector SJRDD-AB1 TaxID=2593771 RepID=A0AA40T062_9NOST|nr:hypothetical protein [Komarekiella delphini-convector]MBD6618223.1 hypothetical protein [Komarekiella delphini-convector SJRDD-AB1]
MPGITLTLRIGKKTPQLAPMLLTEALQSVEVSHKDSDRSGFQIVFQVGRSGSRDLQDDRLLQSPLLEPFNRVILVITLNAKAQVLMDGIITHQEFSPSMEPGRSTLTVTGEDVSVMMAKSKLKIQHPQQSESAIARKIISNYSEYKLIPDIQKPPVEAAPSRNERIPAQSGSDLEYLGLLADRFGYVFYVTPGPGVGQNTAYWGPPPRGTNPQKAITVNMGAFSNADSINFQFDAQSATQMQGSIQERQRNQIRRLQVMKSDRSPLARQSALQLQQIQGVPHIKTFEETGHDLARAQARTQAIVNQSTDNVLTVSGELDTLRYGELLKLRELVNLRGVGNTYDGTYYVKSVTHRLRQGEYKQSFSITREGRGSTISAVRR